MLITLSRPAPSSMRSRCKSSRQTMRGIRSRIGVARIRTLGCLCKWHLKTFAQLFKYNTPSDDQTPITPSDGRENRWGGIYLLKILCFECSKGSDGLLSMLDASAHAAQFPINSIDVSSTRGLRVSLSKCVVLLTNYSDYRSYDLAHHANLFKESRWFFMDKY